MNIQMLSRSALLHVPASPCAATASGNVPTWNAKSTVTLAAGMAAADRAANRTKARRGARAFEDPV